MDTVLTLPGSMMEIPDSLCAGRADIQIVRLEDGLTCIGEEAFAGCAALREVVIPDSVRGIHAGAFRNCTALNKVNLPAGLRYMDKEVFAGCTALTRIEIPAEVKMISFGVFRGCTALKEVVFAGEFIRIYQDAFEDCYSLDNSSAYSIAEHFTKPLSFQIKAGAEGMAGRLSNFTERDFSFDEIHCRSIESVLQSFRFPDMVVQADICGMGAKEARQAESDEDWKETGILYWMGRPYQRQGQEYQALLDRLYQSVYEQDKSFRVETILCHNADLRVKRWSRSPQVTLLTQDEFLDRLKALGSLPSGDKLHTEKRAAWENCREKYETDCMSLPEIEIPYAEPDETERRIVVLGGSFNPPTLAHLHLLLTAVKATGSQKGIFVPSNNEYVSNKMRRQKPGSEILSETERRDMLYAMCRKHDELTVDTCEYGRDKKEKTFETMQAIQKEYPDAVLYFVAGADKLGIIPRWHRSREFLELFRILVVKRESQDPEKMIQGNAFLNKYSGAFSLIKEPEEIAGISSTSVRNLMRDGDESAAAQLDPDVWQMLLDKGWLKTDIRSFKGPFEFLSNFYEAPVTYEGLTFGNNEAAFQAQKCLNEEEKAEFTSMPPGKAKRRGRQVALRPDWEQVKYGIMEDLVEAKFTQNPELAEKLIATGDRNLIEGNTWNDTCWGVNIHTGEGQNHLGQILMKVRTAAQEKNNS